MSLRCQKCGSERVVPKAGIWDQDHRGGYGGGSLLAYVYANPDALFFKGTTYASLYARICGDCGHTEIYADGAAELYDAYRKSLPPPAPTGPPTAAPPTSEEPPETVPEGACLSCGKPIPAAAKACPACGWTWEAPDNT